MSGLEKYIRELEHVPCACCGSTENEVLIRKERFGLPLNTVICKNCALIFTCPRPTRDSYSEFYKSDYRKFVSGSDEVEIKHFNMQLEYTRISIIPFVEDVLKKNSVKSILDIGCSHGGILKQLSAHFPEAALYGVEPSEKISQFASSKTGGQVYTGIFEDYETETNMDLVVFARALNHTINPSENMAKVRGILSENGMLLLIIQDAVSALLNRPPERMAEMTHPYMFTRETIRYFLDTIGFEIVKYQDSMYDARNLKPEDARSLQFPPIMILAKRAEPGAAKLDPPDWRLINQRIEANIKYFEKHKSRITSWQKPTVPMRALRRFMKTAGLWTD